jgi:hypothetical protein
MTRSPHGDAPVVETAPGDRALAARLEAAEAWAAAEMASALPEAVRQTHGIEIRRIGSAHATLARAHPRTATFNRVVGLGIAEPATDAMLDELAAFHAGVRSIVEVASVALTEDLGERLGERGYRPVKPVAVYMNDLAAIPAVACDLRIAEVGTGMAAAFAAMTCEAYGYGEPFPSMLRATFGLPRWRHWLAFDGDRPVSGGLLRVDGEIALSSWGATLSSHRGRGLHDALIVTRYHAAKEAGCRLVTGFSAMEGTDRPSAALRNQFSVGSRVAYLRWTFARGA